MTIPEVYTFLTAPRSKERAIQRLQMMVAELNSCLLPPGLRYDRDVVQTSTDDRIAAIVAKIDDLERRIIQLRKEKAKAILDIDRALDRLEDEREQTILMAFYVGRVPMSEVADMINYSIDRTYQLRRSGIQHLATLQELQSDV